MEIYRDEPEEPPPTTSALRKPITSRVCSGFNIRRVTWFGEMVDVQHISSPMPASRLRNDLAILDFNGQNH